MNKSIPIAEKSSPQQPGPVMAGRAPFGQGRGYVPALAALLVCFAMPLYRLVTFTVHDDLYSYIVLLPFVSWYLIRLKPPRNVEISKPLVVPGAILILAGAAVGVSYLLMGEKFTKAYAENYLSAYMFAFYLCLVGIHFIFLGRRTLRSLAFPLGIMVFMIPLPLAVRDGLQTFLQYGSAYCADGMFRLGGTTFLREGLVFYLGVINLEVAPECSGIHSSWILLITSLLAGYLFLNSKWRRTALAFFVLPLALLRNGFRVFTLGELCIHINVKMIDSPIHHQGGPLFFILSLVPFFLLLAWLRRQEHPRKPAAPQT